MWNKGDRVKLEEGHYYPARSNPSIGSRYECAGTVTNTEPIEDDLHHISVEWDNGSRNGYEDHQLVRHHSLPEGNPNRAFETHRKEEEAEQFMKEILSKSPEDEYKAEYYHAKYFDEEG